MKKIIMFGLFKNIKKLAVASFFSLTIFSASTTHLIRPNSTFESVSLSNSCSTMKGELFSAKCNPALFVTSNAEGISLGFIGKADGNSIDNGRDLIFEPITESLVRRLFEESNFNSFTFNSAINFNTSYFELAYSPYYLLADIYIFNPAYPEISVNLTNRETLRLTSGRVLDFVSNNFFQVYSGISIFYFKDKVSNKIFSLFDLTQKKADDLINFTSESGLDGDLGFYIENVSKFLPDFSMQIKNIASPNRGISKKFDDVVSLRTLYLFERHSIFGIGKGVNTLYGSFAYNFDFYFKNLYENFSEDNVILGLKYSMSLFSVLTGLSKNYQTFGMLFKSDNFNLGVTYALEKDVPLLQKKSDSSTYISLEFVL